MTVTGRMIDGYGGPTEVCVGGGLCRRLRRWDVHYHPIPLVAGDGIVVDHVDGSTLSGVLVVSR